MSAAPFGFGWLRPALPGARDDEATPVGLAPGQMPVDTRRDGSVQPTVAGRDLSRAVGAAAGGMAQGLLDAAKLPGDVYAGRIDPMSDEGIRRAGDLAGFAMTGGIGGAAKQAGEAVIGSGPIRAYHGSPHDFDRFSLAHIGTGEGNQAFGHGLYFAGNEKVAEAYRDASRGLIAPRVTLDGKPYDWQAAMRGGSDDLGDEFAALLSGQAPAKSIDPRAAAGEMMGMAGADPAVAMDALRFRAGGADPAGARAYQDAIDLIRSGRVQGHVPPPRMYEVAIDADPARFMDYGAPLASQPRVRDVLGDLGPVGDRPGLTAGEALSSVQRSVDPATVAASLRDAGVPGVRYDDALSRGLGNGTVRSQNYVTFGDDIVSILRKYGVAGAAGAGGAAAVLAPGDTQAAPSPSGAPMAFGFGSLSGLPADVLMRQRQGMPAPLSLGDPAAMMLGAEQEPARAPVAAQPQEPPAVAPFGFGALAPRGPAAAGAGMGFGPGSPGAGLPLPTQEPAATGATAPAIRPQARPAQSTPPVPVPGGAMTSAPLPPARPPEFGSSADRASRSRSSRRAPPVRRPRPGPPPGTRCRASSATTATC